MLNAKSFRLLLKSNLIIVFAFFLFSCATPPPPPPPLTDCHNYPFDPVGWELTPELLEKYPLNYTKFVEDDSGQRLMKITWKYTGRCPDFNLYHSDDPYSGPNYNRKRLSFYRVTAENLTDFPINRKRLSTRLLIGEYYTKYVLDKNGNRIIKKMRAESHRDYLKKPHPKGNVMLKPREIMDVERWCEHPTGEIWLYTVTVESRGKEYTYTLHEVGH